MTLDFAKSHIILSIIHYERDLSIIMEFRVTLPIAYIFHGKSLFAYGISVGLENTRQIPLGRSCMLSVQDIELSVNMSQVKRWIAIAG